MRNPHLNNPPLITEELRERNKTEILEFIKNEQKNNNGGSKAKLELKEIATLNQDSSKTARAYVELTPLNEQKHLNTYLSNINAKLEDAAVFIGCFEGYAERKERITAAYPKIIGQCIWIFDFLLNRMLPKLRITQKLYFFLSGQRCLALSKAEALGRLCYNGFDILGCEKIGNQIYFTVAKTGSPKTTCTPSGGLVFKMQRLSIGGKLIGVYKVRTMHPYSEYLHEYVVKMNGYNKTGKPKNDFRLTSWGKVIRKCYIDELPQLLNVLKGDLGIVGVRPISQSGFKALPPDLQKERLKFKPGCIPPNVSLGITGFEGVIRAERIYLKQRGIYGISTNIKYFFMAVKNIITRKSKSA